MGVYKKLQTLSGFTARVAELMEALDKMPALESSNSSASAQRVASVVATKAAIETPDRRTLVTDLDLSLHAGQNLLVTGPNGAGKTSFFRTVAGLWPCKEGTVAGPDIQRREVLYLPQTPYLVSGTLREQVVYPDTVAASSTKHGSLRAVDCAVNDALRLAGMERFAHEGLDRTHLEWDDVLSGGEKQRMGWARLFYHSPPYAALDEATSAINVQQEGPLYQAAVDKGITLLSIAHRPTVRQYHQMELNIVGDGSGKWSFIK